MKIERLVMESEPQAREGYILPFRNQEVIISQGYDGPYSHLAWTAGKTVNDDRFFVDFVLPVGTEVVASKEGMVTAEVDTFSRFYEGIDPEKGMQVLTNFIVLEHEDGMKTLYSHIMQGSIMRRAGERVQQGQPIARTGKSGWIGPIPHLHFGAFTNLRGRITYPVTFTDYQGPLSHSNIY